MNDSPAARPLPEISPLMWRWFTWYARGFLRKHMHAVRLMRGGEPPTVRPGEPIVVFANHPSWWDPMLAIFLAQHLWPHRRHYFPIDAAMLKKYRFFAKLGFFGVEPDSARGAAALLRTAPEILKRDDTCLWITAQGRFADVRARPVEMKPGLEHLARRLERGVLVPLAAEYPFWSERAPEALLRFGEPIDAAKRPSTERLETALAATMDELASAAMTRDAAGFVTLLQGRTGTSVAYDFWRRGRAFIAGRRFDPSHMPESRVETEARVETTA